MKALYNLTKVALESSFLNLIMTFNWLLIFLHTEDTCLSKWSLLSLFIPNMSIDSFTGKKKVYSVSPRIKAWCLVLLTIIPLSLYHWFARFSRKTVWHISGACIVRSVGPSAGWFDLSGCQAQYVPYLDITDITSSIFVGFFVIADRRCFEKAI